MTINIIALIVSALLVFFSIRSLRKYKRKEYPIWWAVDLTVVIVGTITMGIIIWLTIQGKAI
jgi:amino acid transporter